MSELVEYLNKVEKDVEKWPVWKQKSLKEALQLSSKAKVKDSSCAITNIEKRSKKIESFI